MTWDDVENILFDGSQDEINAVICPECGGKLSCQYFPETNGTEIRCLKCGALNRGFECDSVPNFAKLQVIKSKP